MSLDQFPVIATSRSDWSQLLHPIWQQISWNENTKDSEQSLWTLWNPNRTIVYCSCLLHFNMAVLVSWRFMPLVLRSLIVHFITRLGIGFICSSTGKDRKPVKSFQFYCQIYLVAAFIEGLLQSLSKCSVSPWGIWTDLYKWTFSSSSDHRKSGISPDIIHSSVSRRSFWWWAGEK